LYYGSTRGQLKIKMNAKTEISSSTALTESLMKIIPDGLLVLDTSNSIALGNAAVSKLLGFSRAEELNGLHIHKIFACAEAADEFLRTLNTDGHSEDCENTFVRLNGTSFTGLYTGALIQTGGSKEFSKLILIRDISSQKRAEKKLADYTRLLEKSNKELDQFAYIISHDLKAPLRAISNLSLWLREDLGTSLSEENAQNLTMLRGRVVRMESLINGVLEYSKIGRVNVTAESVDTFLLLGEILEMLSPPSHVQVEINSNLPVIEAPKTMLLQVFSNLIGNAIKYNDKEKALVRITCREYEGGHEFSVSDNGPGIPEEFQEKIFVIFQTLQSKDKFESTGIGLTIVKRILEDRGGSIRVESSAGQGSTFIFNWPKPTS
jgi:PAS domain S-box-containing protein